MDPMLKNLIRVGRVTKYHPDPKKHLVRVLCSERGLPGQKFQRLGSSSFWPATPESALILRSKMASFSMMVLRRRRYSGARVGLSN